MRQIVRLPLLLLMLMLMLVTPACYTYTPVQAPEPGMEVRAELETEAAVRRSQGLNDAILRYDGVVVDITPGAFSLDVLIAQSSSAFQDVTIRDTIALRNAEIRSLRKRTLSPVRTGLFALGTGVAAFLIVKSIDSIVGGTDDDDDNGRPPAMRIPMRVPP
jgi:hypothetical protein